MTTAEFSSQFNILYDNIASKGAPGVNEYEKSVFFTLAQQEIVKNYYSGYNESQQSFERNENRRRELNDLLIPYSTTLTIDNQTDSQIESNSKFFVIPNDTWYIVYEKLNVVPTTSCNISQINIKPITHDEYNDSKPNPFRKPNKRKGWRLDITKMGGQNVVEIVSFLQPVKYYMRYIKKPKPIILSNFESDSELSGLGLTIDGLNTITECELNSEIHLDILNRAVEMAILNYRENSLQNKVQLNKRNV